MKIYRLPQLADLTPERDYLLGPEELGTETITMLYGRLRPGEEGKTVSAGPEKEALLLVLKGSINVQIKKCTFEVSPGEAFHLTGTDEFTLRNADDHEAVYIVASGCCNRVADKTSPSGNDTCEGTGEERKDPIEFPATTRVEEEDNEFFISRDDEDDKGPWGAGFGG